MELGDHSFDIVEMVQRAVRPDQAVFVIGKRGNVEVRNVILDVKTIRSAPGLFYRPWSNVGSDDMSCNVKLRKGAFKVTESAADTEASIEGQLAFQVFGSVALAPVGTRIRFTKNHATRTLSNRREAIKIPLIGSAVDGGPMILNEFRIHDPRDWELGEGGQGRNRTTDTRIFSPLLYRLSYLATVLQIHLDLPAATHTRILALPTELLGLR